LTAGIDAGMVSGNGGRGLERGLRMTRTSAGRRGNTSPALAKPHCRKHVVSDNWFCREESLPFNRRGYEEYTDRGEHFPSAGGKVLYGVRVPLST